MHDHFSQPYTFIGNTTKNDISKSEQISEIYKQKRWKNMKNGMLHTGRGKQKERQRSKSHISHSLILQISYR